MKLLSIAGTALLCVIAVPLAILLLAAVPRGEWAKLNDSLPPP